MSQCAKILNACCQHFLETLKPLEDLSEKAFNDYLYTKSLEIEPRNCKQPPKFTRKFPDPYLKSPGIKLRSLPGRLHPGPLPSLPTLEPNLLRSTNRIADDRDVHSPRLTAPSTPSSPSYTTPPPTASATNDTSVFASVLISPGGNTSPGLMAPPNYNKIPPPLPPRRKRESSVDDTSPRRHPYDTSPPPLPPPPLPPRRDHLGGGATLPRMHSTTHLPFNASATLDGPMPFRRNSFMDAPHHQPTLPPQLAPRRSSHSVSSNGPTPQLPPRPYRQHFPFADDASAAPR